MPKVSRRDFGRATVAALGGLTLRSGRPIWAKKAPSLVFGGVQIGVMTYSFRDRPLAKALQYVSDIGISSVELDSGHLSWLTATYNEIQSWKKFADAGVRIASYHVHFQPDPTDE
jgi:hypothetical protein